MEGTMAEIRLFAGPFAPRFWAYCQGQTLAISTNQALFSLLGTTFGGNGSTTFQLPDLRSRVPMGTGTGFSGSNNTIIGQIGGEENHTLTLQELPMHTHTVTVSGTLSAPAPPLSLQAATVSASTPDPASDLIAGDSSGLGGLSVFADGSSSTIAMSTKAITSNFTAGTPSATFSSVGSTQPHTNIQPYIAMNYIICLQGIYPSRN